MCAGCALQLVGLVILFVGGLFLNFFIIFIGALLLLAGSKITREAAREDALRDRERLRELDRQDLWEETGREDPECIDDDIIDADYDILDDDDDK